jgi:hypothetical protein
MNAHQIYNLLEGRVDLPYLKSSACHTYPEDYIKRYNFQVDVVNQLVRDMLHEIPRMTELEREQFDYVAGGKYQQHKGEK